MTRSVRSDPKPTWTSLVSDALVRRDDFMNTTAIREAITDGRAKSDRVKSVCGRINAALSWLHRHRAVDCVLGADGRLWWFATPGDDIRTKMVAERTPEDKPRRSKGRRRADLLHVVGSPIETVVGGVAEPLNSGDLADAMLRGGAGS